MAKRKIKAKIKRTLKAAASKPELTVNPIELTNWLDKFVAKCKVLWTNFISWLRGLETNPK